MSVKQLLDLSGRTALVTGGSRGLGLQMAEALGELGAQVALTARKARRARRRASRISPALGSHVPSRCRAISRTRPRSRRWWSAPMTALGPIDILVNNAGATWGAPTVDCRSRRGRR